MQTKDTGTSSPRPMRDARGKERQSARSPKKKIRNVAPPMNAKDGAADDPPQGEHLDLADRLAGEAAQDSHERRGGDGATRQAGQGPCSARDPAP